MKRVQIEIAQAFQIAFGRTPLQQRLQDISKEHNELQRFLDLRNLKEELGDLLCSAIQLANENEWNVEDLIRATLAKIKHRQLQYITLGRKTRVALYGGSFDPIHAGHVAIIKLLLKFSNAFDEVWLMPDYQSLYGKFLTEASHRVAMCNIVAQRDGRVKVCDYLIQHKLLGETYNYMKRLLEDESFKDRYDFSLVIGADSAVSLPTWAGAEYLMKMVKFVVVPRPGTPFDPRCTWFLNNVENIYIEPDPEYQVDISSTCVRSNYWKQQDVQKYLPPGVPDYINQHALYKNREDTL